MTINKTGTETQMVISLEGRLDTNTAPGFEKEVRDNLAKVKELVLDIKELEYISSAGLRVLLLAQKTMNKQGSMHIKNVRDEIMEIFEMTGFTDILNIEE